MFRVYRGVLTLHRAFADVRDAEAADLAVHVATHVLARVRSGAAGVRWSASWPHIAAYVRRWRKRTSTPVRRPRIQCVGTAAQQAALRAAYTHFNATRFAGRLPADLVLVWDAPTKRRLGRYFPVSFSRASAAGKGRRVSRLGLNILLAQPHLAAQATQTLLHEMAHVAAWLFDGEEGHGSAWRAWARRVGTRPFACARDAALGVALSIPADRTVLSQCVPLFPDDRCSASVVPAPVG